MLDPDPSQMNTDTKHWKQILRSESGAITIFTKARNITNTTYIRGERMSCPLPEPEISPNVSRSRVQLDPSTVQNWARSVLKDKKLVNTGT